MKKEIVKVIFEDTEKHESDMWENKIVNGRRSGVTSKSKKHLTMVVIALSRALEQAKSESQS